MNHIMCMGERFMKLPKQKMALKRTRNETYSPKLDVGI